MNKSIEAYVGEITESFKDRKEALKETYSLEFVSRDNRELEKGRDIHVKLQKFIDQKYTETPPWSSLFFHQNPHHLLDWFLENEHEE